MLKVYFKANCATCQTALKLMRDNTKEKFEKIEYLVEIPSEAEIKEILKMLGIKAEQLVRKKEPLYKENYEGKKISNAQWIKILHDKPILIERPIVINGDRAIIGRPVETIVDFIKKTQKR
ncbi:MAG: ArsC/Spx/MgsR family protein [Bacteroidia bacterium]